MIKKIACFILTALILSGLSGCKKEEPVVLEPPASEPVVVEEKFAVNPLTGIKNLDKDKTSLRPVAVMIDNDANAQKYAQSGVSQADIVYETEVEGGITRLMVVFKDITKVAQIGDIRSARYDFVDLAMGHKAVYVHHGRDELYCGPHMNEVGIDNYVVGTNNCGYRHTYSGVFGWQNLFTTGEKLSKALTDANWKLTNEDTAKSWQSFAAEEEKLSLSGVANKIDALFNSASKSFFQYDAESGNYIKTSNHTSNADKNNSSPYSFKNVVILKTSMSYFSNNKSRKIDLSSGSGYYAVNGTYEEIKWKKGSHNNALVLTKPDGTALTMNAGTTWVCIVKNDATVAFS